MEWKSYIWNAQPNFMAVVRTIDNVLGEQCWPVDLIVVNDGVVKRQVHISEGVYHLPDMVKWSISDLYQWVGNDGTHFSVIDENEIMILEDE